MEGSFISALEGAGALYVRIQSERLSYSHDASRPLRRDARSNYSVPPKLLWRRIMGKYVLGWFLGIPAIVLVVAYFFFH